MVDSPPTKYYLECCAAICYDIHMKKREQTFDKALEAIHAFQEALQGTLFPCIEAEIGNLDGKHRDFVAICAAVHGDFPAAKFAWCGNGKPPVSRWSYFKAYMAKAKWNFRTTGALIHHASIDAMAVHARETHPNSNPTGRSASRTAPPWSASTATSRTDTADAPSMSEDTGKSSSTSPSASSSSPSSRYSSCLNEKPSA